MPEQSKDEHAEYSGIVVRSLLIPLNGALLVLPNTAVAEVAEYKQPEPLANTPDWVLGMMLWRGRSVPLLALESALGYRAGMFGVHTRAVICNTLNANIMLPYLAIVAQGIPRLQELGADAVEAVETVADDVQMVAGRLLVNGREAFIPSLDSLEQQLLRMGVRVS